MGRHKGAKKIEVGTEEKPVVGDVIGREDVGFGMADNLVQGDGAGYVGQKVIITH